MVCHFETATQTGEPVQVTLVHNTVILRFSLDGEEQEWAKTDYRIPIPGFINIENYMFGDLDAEHITCEAVEVLNPDITGDGDYGEVEVRLTNAITGEVVEWSAAWDRDSDWGRMYGPIYGKAPAAPVVA